MSVVCLFIRGITIQEEPELDKYAEGYKSFMLQLERDGVVELIYESEVEPIPIPWAPVGTGSNIKINRTMITNTHDDLKTLGDQAVLIEALIKRVDELTELLRILIPCHLRDCKHHCTSE